MVASAMAEGCHAGRWRLPTWPSTVFACCQLCHAGKPEQACSCWDPWDPCPELQTPEEASRSFPPQVPVPATVGRPTATALGHQETSQQTGKGGSFQEQKRGDTFQIFAMCQALLFLFNVIN